MPAVRSVFAWSGGLLFAQFVTLYLTPVFYTYMDAIVKLSRVGGHDAVPEVAGAGADESLVAPHAKQISQN